MEFGQLLGGHGAVPTATPAKMAAIGAADAGHSAGIPVGILDIAKMAIEAHVPNGILEQFLSGFGPRDENFDGAQDEGVLFGIIDGEVVLVFFAEFAQAWVGLIGAAFEVYHQDKPLLWMGGEGMASVAVEELG